MLERDGGLGKTEETSEGRRRPEKKWRRLEKDGGLRGTDDA